MDTRRNTLFETTNDFRAEFFAVVLLSMGLLPENITFRALGPFKRRSHYDVESIGHREIGNFKGPVLESNRSGIYDYLPEQLFHLSVSKSGKTLKKKIEDIRAEREKEQNIRLFFLPLEQEFFFNRVRISQIEQQASELNPESELFEELRDFWQVPNFVTNETFRNLLPLLPHMSGYRADFGQSEIILSTMLHLKVEIESTYNKKLTSVQGSEIGNTSLGTDMIMGGQPDFGLPELQINLYFENPSDFEVHFSKPDFDDLVNWLLGWLLPVEYEYNIRYIIAPEPFFLYDESSDGVLPRIGHTTHITA